MKFKHALLASVAAVALLEAGVAIAQLAPSLAYLTTGADADAFQDVQGGYPTSTNKYLSGTVLRSYIFGSNTLHTAAPVLTGCSGGSGTIAGTDYAFILTGGTTATTSCVATFSVAFNSTPVCTVVSQTAPATTTPSYAVTKTAITITQATNSSEVYDAVCVSLAGG